MIAYKQALSAHDFRTFAGDDASKQPPDIPDALPHETAVSWSRTYTKTRPLAKDRGLDDMELQLRTLLADCAKHINAEHDVDGLRRCFPERLRELVARKGERLQH